LKIRKEKFNKETLRNSIKKLICKEYVDDQLIYEGETVAEFRKKEGIRRVPLLILVRTEQRCSERKFLLDLTKFVDRIMTIYNNMEKPNFDDMLEFMVTYTVANRAKTKFYEHVTYYAYLSIEDVQEKNGIVYVTFGLW